MKVLIIAPHMDDEVLGCGGTIAKHVNQGHTVSVCVVANRAYGHKYDDELIAVEKQAVKAAKEILGYKRLIFLDLPDEQLDSKLIEVIVPLEALLLEIKPDIVYVNHRGDVNQDHQAVFKAAMVACRPISAHQVHKILAYEIPSSTDQSPPFEEVTFIPNYYVDITPFLEKKIQALSCYQREARLFPHPRSPEGISIYAQKRGMEIGFQAAEAFAVIRDQWK